MEAACVIDLASLTSYTRPSMSEGGRGPREYPLDWGGAYVVFLMVPNTALDCNSFVEIRSSNSAVGLQLRGPNDCSPEVPSSNLGRNIENLD